MTSRSDTEGFQVTYPPPSLDYNGPSALDSSQQKRMCGLRQGTFWLVAVLSTFTVLTATIGGGIGRSLADKNKSNTATFPIAQPSSSSSQAPTATGASSSTGTTLPTSTLRTPISTSTIAGSSATLLRDCPSSNNTIYTVQLGSAKQLYRKACNTLFGATKGTGENFVNEITGSLDDCVGRCAQWNINNHMSPSGLVQTCGAVCWRNNFQDDHPGSCFGYAVTKSSDGSFKNDTSTNCDSAVWINEP